IPEIRRPVSCWHEASGTGKVICPATGTGSTISSTNRGKTPCRLPCSRLVIGSRERTGIDRALGSPPLKSVRDVEMFFRPIRDGGGRFDGESRKGLILGVANEKSIAWGVARACHREGAELGFNYLGEALMKRVHPLAESIHSSFVEPLDVGDDGQLDDFFAKVEARWGRLDFIVHSIAFATRGSLKGNFRDTSRADFHLALDISAYSFIACARRAARLMGPGGSMVTMSYLGAVRAVPNYNVMGVAKAALEAATRYLAHDLGPEGIRVNAVSAGPSRTLAASGVGGFRH